MRTATCLSCGLSKSLSLMRPLGQSRGYTPRTCRSCRDDRPGQGWCDSHNAWHPIAKFAPTKKRAIGHTGRCRDSLEASKSAKLGRPPIACRACGEIKQSQRFAGGKCKAAACKDCDLSHPGLRFCRSCEEWLPSDGFGPANSTGRQTYCRGCRSVASHGISIADLLTLQGVESPECGACGSTNSLVVDHDHRHCPGTSGCKDCVTGWLCHPCNTSEGLLGTPERVRKLADWMERVGRSNDARR